MVYDRAMTTTPIRPKAASLADDVQAVHAVPPLEDRRRIRKAAGLSLAQIGQDVGVTGTAVWQWEMRVQRLPVTEKTIRYARLLGELAQVSALTALQK